MSEMKNVKADLAARGNKMQQDIGTKIQFRFNLPAHPHDIFVGGTSVRLMDICKYVAEITRTTHAELSKNKFHNELLGDWNVDDKEEPHSRH